MELQFVPITEQNKKDALALRTAPGQDGFVEPVAQCLDEAKRRRCWQPVGICDGETLVGFAMYGFFRWEYPPRGRVWLDRLLIGAEYQGRGYGHAAVPALIDRLRREYRRRKIYLSVVEENHAAARLYKKFGFRFTGRRDIHGEMIMVCRI